MLCNAIQELEKRKVRAFSVRETGQVMKNHKLVRLVGEKPILNCSLNGVDCEALWDTGAMVSMITADWVKANYPNEEILSIMDFLDGDTLNLLAANNTPVAVEGVVVLNFDVNNFNNLSVPFIVTTDTLNQPIIGYNVIEHMVSSGGIGGIGEAFQKTFPSLSLKTAEAVVNVIRADTNIGGTAEAAARTVIPPHSRCRVKCKTGGMKSPEPEQSILFSPNILDSELEYSESVSTLKMGKAYVNIVVTNPTNVAKVIKKGTCLGDLEVVSAVIPIVPKKEVQEKKVPEEKKTETPTDSKSWLPETDLSHLSEDQRLIAEKVLREECDAFCRNKEDHGDVPDLQMEINLSDKHSCDGST